MQRPSAPIIGAMLAALAAIGLAAFVAYIQLDGPPDARRGGEAQVASGIEIGGPFELTSGSGETVTAADFRGQFMLVFFGYTFCPDVCPTELSNLAVTMDTLPAAVADSVVPVFITVDPERDTPETVGDYVDAFHPAMVGLTGSKQAIDAVAKAYRVYYAKSGDTESDSYLMDHSSYVYLIGPDGDFVTMFQPNTDPEDMAEAIQRYAERAGNA